MTKVMRCPWWAARTLADIAMSILGARTLKRRVMRWRSVICWSSWDSRPTSITGLLFICSLSAELFWWFWCSCRWPSKWIRDATLSVASPTNGISTSPQLIRLLPSSGRLRACRQDHSAHSDLAIWCWLLSKEWHRPLTIR